MLFQEAETNPQQEVYYTEVDQLSTQSDEDIARRVQAGDTEAFGLLVERYEEKLLRYGKRFLANPADIEDIVQDVFVRAYENFRSFDPGQRFSPWIYRIAHNAFVNQLRKSSRMLGAGFDFDTLVATVAYEDPIESERERREVRGMLDQALDTLAPKYKEILILYYLEGLEYKEIADVLHVPPGTVGVRLKRGREALKKSYQTLHGTH